jgi:hypothetical protein
MNHFGTDWDTARYDRAPPPALAEPTHAERVRSAIDAVRAARLAGSARAERAALHRLRYARSQPRVARNVTA